MYTDIPANSLFDGPVTNLLSILCILVEVLSRAQAKRAKSLNHFKFGTSIGRFFEWQCSKHGSERVNLPVFMWLQEELNKANRELLVRKDLKKIQERAEEEKVLEFQRKKAVSTRTCVNQASFCVFSSAWKCDWNYLFWGYRHCWNCANRVEPVWLWKITSISASSVCVCVCTVHQCFICVCIHGWEFEAFVVSICACLKEFVKAWGQYRLGVLNAHCDYCVHQRTFKGDSRGKVQVGLKKILKRKWTNFFFNVWSINQHCIVLCLNNYIY